ncbi:signal transduction histidine kinase [Serinicoccus sp. CNJ-927]|uniref:DUF3046 domain-containing protein n=1 Tax=Serinicoccus TaxID=265976 RepID=UPI0003B661CA|nr:MULTISPECIES: DUF3046 domain-containing protein [Serinicoccus]OLT17372.1 signal transduction histidine kinase [Serinicoccus sp. CUA-874]OLT45044.1 signal transduction histidine kinase [Serinicoccus sp. CNJ-927]
MRLSEFWELVEQEFGSGYGAVVARTQVLGSLGGRTIEDALEQGERPRRVWEAVCRDMDVPPEHHHLPDPPAPDEQ